jgi:hypothetical protein
VSINELWLPPQDKFEIWYFHIWENISKLLYETSEPFINNHGYNVSCVVLYKGLFSLSIRNPRWWPSWRRFSILEPMGKWEKKF